MLLVIGCTTGLTYQLVRYLLGGEITDTYSDFTSPSKSYSWSFIRLSFCCRTYYGTNNSCEDVYPPEGIVRLSVGVVQTKYFRRSDSKQIFSLCPRVFQDKGNLLSMSLYVDVTQTFILFHVGNIRLGLFRNLETDQTNLLLPVHQCNESVHYQQFLLTVKRPIESRVEDGVRWNSCNLGKFY